MSVLECVNSSLTTITDGIIKTDLYIISGSC